MHATTSLWKRPEMCFILDYILGPLVQVTMHFGNTLQIMQKTVADRNNFISESMPNFETFYISPLIILTHHNRFRKNVIVRGFPEKGIRERLEQKTECRTCKKYSSVSETIRHYQ